MLFEGNSFYKTGDCYGSVVYTPVSKRTSGNESRLMTEWIKRTQSSS